MEFEVSELGDNPIGIRFVSLGVIASHYIATIEKSEDVYLRYEGVLEDFVDSIRMQRWDARDGAETVYLIGHAFNLASQSNTERESL